MLSFPFTSFLWLFWLLNLFLLIYTKLMFECSYVQLNVVSKAKIFVQTLIAPFHLCTYCSFIWHTSKYGSVNEICRRPILGVMGWHLHEFLFIYLFFQWVTFSICTNLLTSYIVKRKPYSSICKFLNQQFSGYGLVGEFARAREINCKYVKKFSTIYYEPL